jgi:OOP family OmpA-OmpF porin
MATKKMTKLSMAMASSFMLISLANAATPGTYAGIGLGASNINAANNSMFLFSDNSTTATQKRTSQESGLGGKLFVGYNFNPYLGLEANYATYASTTNKASVNNSKASADYSMNTVSLVGKAYLPIQQDFNVYALGGAAEVYSTVNYKNNSNGAITLNNNLALQNGSHTIRKLRPTYGIGASYDVNSHFNTGLEFSRIQGNGNTQTNANAIPSANLLTLTAAYNFG